MSDHIDPEFGPLERRRGAWRGTLSLPALGGPVPFEFDSVDRAPPEDDQRACLSDFISRCDEDFIRRLEQALFHYATAYRAFDLFGREKEALDNIAKPPDVWHSLHDLSILVFLGEESGNTLALRWTADWDDEHGVQVLYRMGGDIKATIIGDEYFDDASPEV